MSLRLKEKADHWMSIFFILEDIPCGTAPICRTQNKNVLTGIVSNKNLFLCSQKALLHALLVLLCLKKDILIMNKKSAASFNIS